MTVGPGKSVSETSFDEATRSFEEFLSEQGLPSDLCWVFQEDVVFRGKRIFIKISNPTENWHQAEACYELGRSRNFGMNLHAFCLLESRPCCYVILPEGDLDAQYMLMANSLLKYSVWTDLREAEAVSNPLRWQMLRWRNPKSQFLSSDDHIPSKVSLLPEYRVALEG
jgi:hypothetical protein